MKIKVTQNEACDALRSHFQQSNYGLTVESVEISPVVLNDTRPTISLVPLVNAARAARSEFVGSHKIAAIKAVRAEAAAQGFFVGLADAKLFVESIVHGI